MKMINTEFTQEQKEIVFGSLLGDGYLIGKYNPNNELVSKVCFAEEHCERQLPYLAYKYAILADKTTGNGIKLKKRHDDRLRNPDYTTCWFNTSRNENLKEFYDLFYDGRKVDIPADLSLLTPLALSIWFMDDGYKNKNNFYISANSYSRERIENLQKFLLQKYGIETSVSQRNVIYFKASTRNIFLDLIRPYIVDCMGYKLN